MKRRIYDFDNIEKIGDILEMSLEWGNTEYIDRSSAEELVDCDRYFEWQLIRMLDELSDEAVAGILTTVKDGSGV